MGYSHPEEKVFVNKNGKVTRVQVMKHYAPNPASLSLYLKAHKSRLYRESIMMPHAPPGESIKGKTYEQFCVDAGYPSPFPKQIEMKDFGIHEKVARLLLGSRGYGKTDYVVILGIAYEIYKDFQAAMEEKRAPIDSTLIVTKSDERNAAMLDEIRKCAEANGVQFEKANASCLRVLGLHGKDHSVSAITVGTSSIRGRHPKRIIMDDPVTEEDISEPTRKKVQRVYNELNKLCPNILVIGQPVHKFDLYGSLRDILKKMEVPHGSIPELDHDLEAQRLAGVSEESIQASYFLKVTSETGFPLENVKDIDAWPKEGGAFAFVDPSFKGGDYTALTILKGYFDGVVVYGKVYKRAWYNCIDDMALEMRNHGVQRMGFETNSLGEQPLDQLRDVMPGIGVVGKHSSTNKHSRIVAAGAYAHLIHICKNSDKNYIDQIKKYEYGSEPDDAPDSLASCLEMVGLIRGKVKT